MRFSTREWLAVLAALVAVAVVAVLVTVEQARDLVTDDVPVGVWAVVGGLAAVVAITLAVRAWARPLGDDEDGGG